MQRLFNLTDWSQRLYLPLFILGCLLPVTLLGGCAIFGPAAVPTPTAPAYAAVPTFTPTPQLVELSPPPTDTLTVAVAPVASAVVVTTTAPLTPTQAVILPTVQVITPTNTPAAEPRLIITGDAVNVRSGPGTTFETVGAAVKGGNFQLLARNAQGDWWQICCVNGQPGWVFGALATVENAEGLAIVADAPTPVPPTLAAVAEAPTAVPVVEPTPTSAPAAPAPPPANDASAGDFNPDAQYQIVHFKVLGLNENNGGIRDSQAQHHIFLTVLDQGGNGLDGVVVENLVGEKGQIVTGSKGPGKAEVTMYYEPFKLRVLSDGSGPVTSQISNQMGLAFPHLPDIVGKLGGLDYEYAVCPTLDVKCQWPIQAVHFSYEITFQKVK